MKNAKILVLYNGGILDYKLYCTLKRSYKVDVARIENIAENRKRQYESEISGSDRIIFSSESLFNIVSECTSEEYSSYFHDMFEIAGYENIPITYIRMSAMLDSDFINADDSVKNEYHQLDNRMSSALFTKQSIEMICIPPVYGHTDTDDIIEMVRHGKYKITDQMPAPILADKAAASIADSLESRTAVFPEPAYTSLTEWFMASFSDDLRPESDDANIRVRQEHCVLDFVYSREPEDSYDGYSIAEKRLECGRMLASSVPKHISDNIDFVTPVPRTGLYYAMGLAEELGVPYRQALIKNSYTDRSFQLADSHDRKKFIWNKIFPIQSLINGQRIAVVDEAIFTGTTLKVVCEMLTECGAREIYLCIPTPPCTYHCDYMVTPQREMLLEYMNINYLKNYFGVNDIFFQDVTLFRKFCQNMDSDVCMECFYGK